MFDDSEKIRKRYFSCQRDNLKIFCEMITPTGKGPFPLIVYAHPYGEAVHAIRHEEVAYQGIAICSFDFCGGSLESRSDGASTDMSVATEAADLKTVLEDVKKLPYIDNEKIYLLGMSQGGFVATMVAAQYAEDVSGLILLCPAYVLQDFEQIVLKGREVPERFWFRNMNIGKKYVLDLKSVDIYKMMEKYPGPVRIYYGDQDEIVSVSYIERAVETFPNAEYVTIPGADHALHRKNGKLLLEGIVRLVNGDTIEETEDFTADAESAEGTNNENRTAEAQEISGNNSKTRHAAFIYLAPQNDPETQNAILYGPILTLHVVGCANYQQAVQVAKELVDKGCRTVELCAGFGSEGVARIQKSVGPNIVVGSVRFDLHPMLGFRSGDQIFE